jgi:hypothetical protein
MNSTPTPTPTPEPDADAAVNAETEFARRKTASVLPPPPPANTIPLPPGYLPQSQFQPSPYPHGVAISADAEVGQVIAVSDVEVFHPEAVHEFVAPKRSRLRQAWEKIGGGSLTFSLLVHIGLFLLAGIVIFTNTIETKNVDFLPGGGTQQGQKASEAVSAQVEKKRRSTLTKTVPMQRLAALNSESLIQLPDTPPELLNVPDMSSMFGGGGMMGSGGFGKGGAGGGFGDGLGMGGMSGVTFKPIMMFGMELKDARKIAVVMDVSRSMTRYLPVVANELDKVARGSALVLYFGCGVANPPRSDDIDDKAYKATGEDFATFWQNWQGKAALNMVREERRKLKYDPSLPMPLEAIYQKMDKRPNTYFIEFNGIQYAWTALMSREVMEADTIYWFADFQDRIDEKQAEIVVKKLKSRKQKLYIHASTRGRFFEQAKQWLVEPLGGEVIETKAEPVP